MSSLSPALVPEWELLQTNTLSAVNTVTTAALPVRKAYKIVLEGNTTVTDYMKIQFNADGGANYTNLYIANVTATSTTGDTSIFLGHAIAPAKIVIEAIIEGLAPTIASGRIGVAIDASIGNQSVAGSITGMHGSWTAGSAVQISTMTVFSHAGQTFTGTLRVFGRN